MFIFFRIEFNNIKPDDVNFDEDDAETIINVRPMAWHNELKQLEVFQKDISKEIMRVAWHPTKYWDWCMPVDEEKRIEPIFTDDVGKSYKC